MYVLVQLFFFALWLMHLSCTLNAVYFQFFFFTPVLFCSEYATPSYFVISYQCLFFFDSLKEWFRIVFASQ